MALAVTLMCTSCCVPNFYSVSFPYWVLSPSRSHRLTAIYLPCSLDLWPLCVFRRNPHC